MAEQIHNLRIPLEIPDLCNSLVIPHRNLRASLIPGNTSNRTWANITKSNNLIIIPIPHVETRIQGNR